MKKNGGGGETIDVWVNVSFPDQHNGHLWACMSI